MIATFSSKVSAVSLFPSRMAEDRSHEKPDDLVLADIQENHG